MHPAHYYRLAEDQRQVVCQLCPHNCRLGEGQRDRCRIRRNAAGRLYTSNYAACTGLAVEPIEKKPLFHYYRLPRRSYLMTTNEFPHCGQHIEIVGNIKF